MESPAQNPTSAAVAPSQTQAKKSNSHLPSIDGLRALAAMAVVYVHCWVSNGINLAPQFSFHGITIPVYKPFSLGYTGVFLFFILSGFCLSYPFYSKPDRKDNWPGYFLSRIRRILPPYLISFLVLFLLGQWLKHHADDPFFQKLAYESFKWKKFLREVFLISPSRIVASYWTLVLEWRWYLLFPAFLMLSRKITPALVVLLTCGIAYVRLRPALNGPIEASTFGNVLTALPMFGFGMWAAYLCASAPEKQFSWERQLVKHSHWGVLVSVLWTIYFCPPVDNAPLHASVVAWSPLFFFLVIASIKHPLFNKILSWRPLAKLGLVSYSIYLLQEPIIRALNHVIHKPEHGPWTYLLTNFIFIPIICAFAGWAFYFIGEKPFLKRKKADRS